MLTGVAIFGEAPGLNDTLAKTAGMIAGSGIDVARALSEAVDFVLHVDPNFVSADSRDYAIWGNGWCCAAGPRLDVPARGSSIPIGPMLAATFGAAEAFQRITNWHGEGRAARPSLYFSAWQGCLAAEWGQLVDGPEMRPLSIEPFYLCGAGAVGQAFAATLSYFPERTGHAVILDGDPLTDTNLNRYCLSHRESPAGKSEICKAALGTANYTVDAQPLYWDGYQKKPYPRTTCSALDTSEGNYRYRLLVSCVDTNVSRHELQNFWPRLILGGSTSGLTAKVSRYDCFTGECLNCSNPLPVLPTIEEEARTLREMKPPDRDAALKHLSPEEASLVLADLNQQTCGHAAEQYLNEIGELRRREFSVGFVSVAAGVLLAVGLIQHAWSCGELVQGEANQFTFSFLSRMPGKEFFTRDPGCDCAGRGGTILAFLVRRTGSRLSFQLWRDVPDELLV